MGWVLGTPEFVVGQAETWSPEHPTCTWYLEGGSLVGPNP